MRQFRNIFRHFCLFRDISLTWFEISFKLYGYNNPVICLFSSLLIRFFKIEDFDGCKILLFFAISAIFSQKIMSDKVKLKLVTGLFQNVFLKIAQIIFKNKKNSQIKRNSKKVFKTIQNFSIHCHLRTLSFPRIK